MSCNHIVGQPMRPIVKIGAVKGASVKLSFRSCGLDLSVLGEFYLA